MRRPHERVMEALLKWSRQLMCTEACLSAPS